ncbi:hypothetical protein H5410_010626 [Solanum commersonii]|uniref:Uncharacterized protein n=1 Tax=Solanum commersonii TaxID=4109 RepID=A0A9J6AL84_SOLCO|nr:hypothetical protein H5410_010626 [Solanum commersonii]
MEGSYKNFYSQNICIQGTLIYYFLGKSNLPSLEHDALGNFYAIVVATVEANQSRKELSDFVNVVGSTTRDIATGIGKASINDITSLSATYGTKVISKLGQKDVDNYPSTRISLMDTKDGAGIEAWVVLKENDMIEFERDPNILSNTNSESSI